MRIVFDIPFLILIALPFLGGIWIWQPHLKVEYTHFFWSVVFSFLWILLIQKTGKNFREHYFFKKLTIIGSRWFKEIQKSWIRAATLGSIFFGVLWSFASIRRHEAFHSASYDLGLFTNAFFNFNHGHGYFSSPRGGINLFTDHQSYIVVLLAQVFRVYPHAEGLLILQAFALTFCAVPLLAVAIQVLGKNHWFIAYVPFLIWLNAPLQNANAFDFHPEVVMLPFFLTAFYFAIRNKPMDWAWSAAFLILALCSKETAAPVGFGLSFLVSLRSEKLVWAGLSAAFFVFDLFLEPKLFNQSQIYLSSGLDVYGNGWKGLLAAPFVEPKLFWGNLLGASRFKFLFGILSSTLFLPILSWPFLLAVLPAIALLFLFGGDTRVRLDLHYCIEPLCVLLLGAVYGLKNFKISEKVNKHWMAFAVILIFAGKSPLFRIRFFTPTDHEIWLRNEALPKINSTETLSVSSALSPHLATRFWLKDIPDTEGPDHTRVSCLIYDSNVNNWLASSGIDRSHWIKQGYTIEYSCGSFEVWHLDGVNCVEGAIQCSSQSELALF